MDFLDRIGPILGVAAFLGFSVLALLIFMQAREVRRLREWAGRAPERKLEADEATQAAAEAAGEDDEDERGRLAGFREGVGRRFGPAWDAVDRNSPVDPRWLVALLVALLIAAGVVTSGFGLLGGDDEPAGGGGGEQKSEKPEAPKLPKVAVLNATQTTTQGIPVAPVPGLAATVSEEIVQPAGYKVKAEETAVTGIEDSVVMYEEGGEADAEALAEAVAGDLGDTAIEPMIQEVRDLAKGAELALVVGFDDAETVAPDAAG